MQLDIQPTQESYTLDGISYSNLISCLETMTPFEAIRQAEEINKINGFEVVSLHTIRSWKRKMKNQNPIFASKKSKWNSYKGIGFSEIEIQKFESRKLQKDNLEIKKHQLQKGYMKLLSL